jgi:hypothetical protein
MRARRLPITTVFLALSCFSAACSSEGEFRSDDPGTNPGPADTPANVAGAYVLEAIHGENGCGFKQWETGKAARYELTVQQQAESLTAQLKDVYGVLAWAPGMTSLSGSVEGAEVTVQTVGNAVIQTGACAHFVQLTVKGTLDGERLRGALDFSVQPNENAQCAPLLGCESIATYTGTRSTP